MRRFVRKDVWRQMVEKEWVGLVIRSVSLSLNEQEGQFSEEDRERIERTCDRPSGPPSH